MVGISEKNLYDIVEIGESNIECLKQEELMELKEINDRMKRITNKERIINHTNSDLFNEVYLGGDWISNDSPLDF